MVNDRNRVKWTPPQKKKKADTFEEEMEDRGYYASLKRLEVVFFFLSNEGEKIPL